MKNNIEILPALKVAYVRETGKYEEKMANAFKMIYEWYNSIDEFAYIPPRIIGQYWYCEDNSPVSGEKMADACVVIPENFTLTKNENIKIQTISGGKYITKLFKESASTNNVFEKIWTSAYNDFKSSDVEFRIEEDAPTLEIYYNNPFFSPYKYWILDIAFAIK